MTLLQGLRAKLISGTVANRSANSHILINAGGTIDFQTDDVDVNVTASLLKCNYIVTFPANSC